MSKQKVHNEPKWVQELRRGRKRRYRVDLLSVGQTLLIPVDEQGTRSLASFRSVVAKAGRKLQRVFAVRQCEDGSFEVYRRS